MSTDMKALVIAGMNDSAEKAETLATKIGAATTDREKLVHDYLNPDEGTEPVDETIAAHLKWREKAMAAIEEADDKAREHIRSNYLEDVDENAVNALKVEYTEQADAYKAARKFFLTLPGATEDDLSEVKPLKTLRGGTAKGGSGSKRPRLQRIAYRTSTSEPWTEMSKETENAKGETVTTSSFSVAAAALKSKFGTKVEVKDLQAAAFEAAGTDDLSTKGGEVFEFATSVGDQTVFIQIQPKADSDE